MKEKEFNGLTNGDIVICKGRKAKISAIGYTLVEVQYFDTQQKVWKSARQITTRREEG